MNPNSNLIVYGYYSVTKTLANSNKKLIFEN